MQSFLRQHGTDAGGEGLVGWMKWATRNPFQDQGIAAELKDLASAEMEVENVCAAVKRLR
jgi:hypothetical protein